MEELRIGVIGAGSIGGRHVRNIATLGVAEVLVSDPDSSVLAQAEELGARGAGSLESLFESDPDAVWICSPPHLHLDHCRMAVERGCDFFVEKPLSHRTDDVEAVIESANGRGLITMVACNMRFHPGPAQIKKLLAEGHFGRVISARLKTGSYLPRWRPWQDFRSSYTASPKHGGAILDCIHEIDLALWYFGPAELKAAVLLPAATLDLDTDGLAELLLMHEAGILSSVHLNFVQRDYRRTCEVVCEHGTIYWDFTEGTVITFDEKGERGQIWAQPDGYEVNEMYIEQTRHFLDAVLSREASCNPLASGFDALKIGLAARCWS